jgi:ELWxxDGT repeat protein
MIRDIFPGQRSPNIDSLTVVDRRLYFVADDGEHGRELWMSDGTYDGTRIVEDLVPGPGSSNPRGLTNLHGVLHYFASDGGDDLSLRRISVPPVSAYEQWAAGQGLGSDPPGALGADPDADGLANVTEYELGTNPLEPRSGRFMVISAAYSSDGLWGYFDVTYLRRKNASARGLVYFVERSDELRDWFYTLPDSETEGSYDADFDAVTLHLRRPAAQRVNFVRIGVVSSP